jgi:hypothetical protein
MANGRIILLSLWWQKPTDYLELVETKKVTYRSDPGDLTVSKRTGTSNRIEIQFRTFNHLSRPDSFVKLFGLCVCVLHRETNNWDKFEIEI